MNISWLKVSSSERVAHSLAFLVTWYVNSDVGTMQITRVPRVNISPLGVEIKRRFLRHDYNDPSP